MAEKQDAKRKKIKKNLEVLEFLNDEKRRNKEVTKEKKLNPELFYGCDENSSEKLSNQVVIEN